MLPLSVFFLTEQLALTVERHNESTEDVKYSNDSKVTLGHIAQTLLFHNEMHLYF